MGNKTRPKARKLKNRGGEKITEWRILSNYSGGLKKKSNTTPSSNVDCEPSFCDSSDVCSSIDSKNKCSSQSFDTDSILGVKSEQISGRRIIDIHYFVKELKEISDHAPQFGCTFANMDLKCEVKRGLRSGFLFQCNMCGMKKTAWSEDINDGTVMDINSAAVAGVISSGGGYTCLQTFMGAMNIRCMNYNTFNKHQNIVANGWELSALQEMKKAADEEICLAKQRGDVDHDGVPLLTVVADGSWAKRSYRTNYNSLSGVVSSHHLYISIYRVSKNYGKVF